MIIKTVFNVIFFTLLIGLLNVQANGQDALTDADRAVVAFDFNIAKLVAEAKSQDLQPEEMLKNSKLPRPFRSLTFADVKQIDGGISLPDDLSEITSMGPYKNVPAEGFVRIRLVNAEAGKKFGDDLAQRSLVTTADDGTTQYRSKSEADPPNLSFRKVSDTEYEMLTDKFLKDPRRDFMSTELAKRWTAMPEKPIRIAIEGKTNAELIAQAAEMVKEENPTMSSMIDSVAKMKAMTLAVGMDGENLIDLLAVANTADDAAEFKSVLNGLLFLAKSQGKGMLANMDRDSPIVKTANEVLDSLKAKQAEENVTVKVAVPAELAAAIGATVMKVRETARRVQRANDLRQTVLGIFNYESAHMTFPFNLEEKVMHPELSWRVAISPFVEGPMEFDYTKGPKDPANAKFADKMPEFFGSNNDATVSWVESDVRKIGSVTDGTSNTICFIENPKGKTPWMERNDISQEDAHKLIKSLPDGEQINVAFYDGSVHVIDNTIDAETLKNLLNPRDNNIVDFP